MDKFGKVTQVGRGMFLGVSQASTGGGALSSTTFIFGPPTYPHGTV